MPLSSQQVDDAIAKFLYRNCTPKFALFEGRLVPYFSVQEAVSVLHNWWKRRNKHRHTISKVINWKGILLSYCRLVSSGVVVRARTLSVNIQGFESTEQDRWIQTISKNSGVKATCYLLSSLKQIAILAFSQDVAIDDTFCVWFFCCRTQAPLYWTLFEHRCVDGVCQNCCLIVPPQVHITSIRQLTLFIRRYDKFFTSLPRRCRSWKGRLALADARYHLYRYFSETLLSVAIPNKAICRRSHPPKFEGLDQTLKRVLKHWRVTQDKLDRATARCRLLLSQKKRLEFEKERQIELKNRYRQITQRYRKMINVEAIKQVKILILGNSGVGKTQIVRRIFGEGFDPNTGATLGTDITSSDFTIDGRSVTVNFWDTAGQERSCALTEQYYRNSMGAILVYDSNSKQSFRDLTNLWYKEIERVSSAMIPILVIANKVELGHQVAPEGRAPVNKAVFWTQSHDGIFTEFSARDAGNRVIDSLIAKIKQLVEKAIKAAPLTLPPGSIKLECREEKKCFVC